MGSLLGQACGVAAVVLAACGLFLVFLDLNPAPAEPSPIRRRLGAVWRDFAAVPARSAPMAAARDAVRGVDRFVAYWFEQSERNVATGGAFTLIVLVAIPISALLNALRGGSPFLILVIATCAVGVIVLGVLSETGRAPRLAEMLAPLLSAMLLLFVPGYVFVSLTDHTLNTPIGHAALFSLLVTPLLYFVCHSTVLLVSGVGRPWRAVTLTLAALPIAYLGVFACLVLGHVAMPEAAVPSNWRALLVAMAAGAVSAAATQQFARSLAGLALASAVALVAAAVVGAAASPWLVAVPLAPPLALWAVAGLALLAKLAVALMGAERAARRPYMVAGLSGLVVAAAASWAAAVF